MVTGQQPAKRLVILGATGSIGQSTASVIEDSGDYCVEAVVGGSDVAALAKMAVRLGARHAVIHDATGYHALREALAGHEITVAAGPQAVLEAAVMPCDLVVGAIVGTAGVPPTYAALQAGRTIALANKECMVCAGEIFMRSAKAHGAVILPLDSEHNAIFQALNGWDASQIENMTITASGGPFRTWTKEAIGNARPEQALAHPNWSMGRKVSIDSAGLMNKGLELIEAHHLFAIPPERLQVLVHPQSIVHGLVSYGDGSVVAVLAAPDMRTPIAHCLAYPHRRDARTARLDLAQVGALTFERPDLDKFPALGLAIAAMKAGQGLPTVLNAANEVAVNAYLSGYIGFADIARIVEGACDQALRDGTANSPQSIADALAVDHITRERLHPLLAGGR
ncbi:MAG: 1-deoxy-D-xylulose-5-phosphate reductoisomerase [Hyphomicrobiales bacterium]|nr:1-deoxy-D-xylulose-5-phosphate reductoisomerase [Hyphomicrobiales bacterium]MDE2114221.1 1-deoxy-D-xylulose-5-phosphate reductoisomerase [Hyphomicrobiales bacterium]